MAEKKSNVKIPSNRLGRVTGYITNVAKSIEYAGIKKLKTMNPTIASFSESNAEVFKIIYKSAIDYRTTYRRGVDTFKKTKFYEAGAIGLKALKEDIMSGNLYNVEREKQLEDKAADSFLGGGGEGGDDFDLSSFGGSDINFDDWDNDDFGWDVDPDESGDEVNKDDVGKEITEGDKLVASSIEGSAQANANAISMAITRSAEYQGEISIKNTNLLYTHNIRAFGMMNSHLEAMNSNIGSVMEYLDKNVSPHLKNSTDFFTNITPLLQDQVSLLREIAQNTKPQEEVKKEEKKKNHIDFNDIVGGNGLPNFDEYIKRIGKNIKAYANEQSMGIGNLLNSMGEDTNILATLAANPYGHLMDAIMNRITPKTLEKAFLDMNKSLAGFFGSFATKMNTMANDEDGSFISKAVGRILGVQVRRKTDIDTSKYEKGKVDWNGKSEKALTELIPNKLDKIISLLSGKEETTYDYETGKYVTINELEKEFDRMKEGFWKSASSDIKDEMNKMIEATLAFGSKSEKDSLVKAIDNMLKTLYSQNKLLDINDRNLRERYSEYGVASEEQMAIIASLVRALPKNLWHEFNTSINEQYSSEKSAFEHAEKSGKYNILFNRSNSNEFAKYTKEGKINKRATKTMFNTNYLIDTEDKFGRNIFWYLQNVYRELNYMRKYGSGGFTGTFNDNDDVTMTDQNGNVITLVDSSFRHVSDNAIKETNKAKNKKSEATIEQEKKDKENEKFLKEQEKKFKVKGKKGKKDGVLSHVNTKGYEDAKSLENALETNLEILRKADEIKRNGEKKETLLEKVLAAKTLSEKASTIVDKINNLSKKPVDFLEKSLAKADEHLFNLIYGKQGLGKEKSVKGFLDAMIFQLNKSFMNFNTFMEEKILNPLKEKLGLDMDKSLFKGLMERFGLDEKKQNVKDWLKERTTALRDGLKESFRNIGNNIKDSFKDVFQPLTDKLKEMEKKKKPKEFSNEEEDDDYEASSDEVRRLRYKHKQALYDNADDLGKIDIRQDQINKYNQTKNRKQHAKILKQYNHYLAKLDEIDKKYGNMKEKIKREESLDKQMMQTRRLIDEVRREIDNMNNSDMEPTPENMNRINNLQLRLSSLELKLTGLENEYVQFRMVNPEFDEELQAYLNDEDRMKLEDKADRFKEHYGLYSDEEIKGFEKDIDNVSRDFLFSDQYSRMSDSQKKDAYQKITGEKNQKKLREVEREIKRYQKMQNNPNNKKDYSDKIEELEKERQKLIDKTTYHSDARTMVSEAIRNLNKEIASLSKFKNRMESGSSGNINDEVSQLVKEEQKLRDQIKGIQDGSNQAWAKRSVQERNKAVADKEARLRELETQRQDLLNMKVNVRGYGNVDQLDKAIKLKQKELDKMMNLHGVDFKELYSEDFINSLDAHGLFKDNDPDNIKLKVLYDAANLVYSNKLNYDESQFSNTKVGEFLLARDQMLNPVINELYTLKNSNKNDKKTLLKIKELENRKSTITESFNMFEERAKSLLGINSLEGKDLTITDLVELFNQEKSVFDSEEETKIQENRNEWVNHIKENSDAIISKLEEGNDKTGSMADILNNILTEIKNIRPNPTQGFGFGPGKNSLTLPNVRSGNEKSAVRRNVDGLIGNISNTIRGFFNNIPGFSKGGYVDQDQLAVVGKGEYVLTPEKREQISGIIGQKIESMKNSKGGIMSRKMGNDAKDLYRMIASVLGDQNLSPKELESIISETGEGAQAFNRLETMEESRKVLEMIKRTQTALNQRREGKINNSGELTEAAQEAGVQDVFSETFQIYKRTLDKTLNIIMGDNPERERKELFNKMPNILQDAKIHLPDLVSGGLIGAGASILTGFMVGPLLGAGIGAGLALTNNSKTVQNMLFGEHEYDKDGNIIGRAGGIIPKNIVNKVGKIFPDLKKFGVVGAVTGLLPVVPFGPVGGLLIGGAAAFAKNNATVQERLFGEGGAMNNEKFIKFKKSLPNILAGAGIGLGASILGFSTPFGLVGNLILGSGLGFASQTDKFQKMIFGEYDEDEGKYVGGLIPFLKDKLVFPIFKKIKNIGGKLFDWVKRDMLKPVLSAIAPFTKQFQLMGKALFNSVKGIITKFTDSIMRPIRKMLNTALDTILAPFRGIAKFITRRISKLISAPFRALGWAGRKLRSHQIKTGNADYMTAEERIKFQQEQDDIDFFYKDSQKRRFNSRKLVSGEFKKKFGLKESAKFEYWLSTGDFDRAEKMIHKNFGDASDPESLQIKENMLKALAENKKYRDLHNSMSIGAFGGSTHEEKVRISNMLKDEARERMEKYNRDHPDNQIENLDDFINMERGNDKYTKNRKHYNLQSVDEFLAGTTDKQIKELLAQFQTIYGADKDFKKEKKKTGKDIRRLLESLDLPELKQRQITSLLSDGGVYTQEGLDKLMKYVDKSGIQSKDYNKFAKLVKQMEDFIEIDKLRIDKDYKKSDLERFLKEKFGDHDIFKSALSIDDFTNRLQGELRARNLKGGHITKNDVSEDDPVQKDVSTITDYTKSIASDIGKIAEKIGVVKKESDEKFNSEEEIARREEEKQRLSDTTANEKSLTPMQEIRLDLIKRMGYKSLAEADLRYQTMPIKKLMDLAFKYEIGKVDSDVAEIGTKYYKNMPEFMKKTNIDQFNRAKDLYRKNKRVNFDDEEDQQGKGEGDEKPKKQEVKVVNDNNSDKDTTVSSLDDEGNEVVMKRDNKTGQMEADLSDSSTKKSINSAKELKGKQMAFYDKFLSLFKKQKDEEKEEKKGGWLSKILAALGIGKSLLGGAKNLLGGVLGKGLLGGLFSRGILGKMGKVGLVLGGLMYLPEIIDLFKTKIAPALSESWNTQIKPWLVEEGLPRLKEGLALLLQELPTLIGKGIKFTVTNLIPGIGKGLLEAIGWDIKDNDNPVTYTDPETGETVTSSSSSSQPVSYEEQVVGYDEETGEPIYESVPVYSDQQQTGTGGKGGKTPLGILSNFAFRSASKKGAKYADKVIKNVNNLISKEGYRNALIKTGTKEGRQELLKNITKGGTKKTGKEMLKSTLKFMKHPVFNTAKAGTKLVSKGTDIAGKQIGNVLLKVNAKFMKNGTEKATATILDKMADDSIIGRAIKQVEKAFTKVFSNKAVIKLLGYGKGGISIAQYLIEKFCPKILKMMAKSAAKATGKMAARLASVAGTSGLMSLGFAVWDFISGFNDARNILSITSDDIGIGARIVAGIVKMIQGFTIVLTLFPTSTIINVLIEVLDFAGLNMSGIKEEQEAARKEVEEYNKKNNTSYSIEEYNEEIKGHKSLWKKLTGWMTPGDKSSYTKKVDSSEMVNGKPSAKAVSSSQTQIKNPLINGSMSVGKGPDDNKEESKPSMSFDTVVADIRNSDLADNIKEEGSNYAKDRLGTNAVKYGVKGLKRLSNSNMLNTPSNNSLVNKVKDILKSLLHNDMVVAILGDADNGKSLAKLLYDNFVPKFIKVFAENLTKSLPKAITRLTASVSTGGVAAAAFAVTDFVTGFENAESILGVVDNASFIEKIIAGLLEALKGMSILSIVPSDLIVTLLFDFLDTIGINTGNIGERREKAKQIVAEYNKKNSTDYNVASYNSEVLGRKGFFGTVKSGLEKVQKFFFGKGEGDIANGNPYYSQKQFGSSGFGKLMGDSGCGPTSTAMALSKVTGKDISPESIAKSAYKNGSWDAEGARGNMFSTEASKYGVKTIDAGGSFENFDRMVSAGIPTAVSGTYGKGDSPYTSAGHIVTVFGKDGNGNYLVNDPRGKQYSKAYTKEELMNGFRNSWSFGKGDSLSNISSSKDILSKSNVLRSATSSVVKLYDKPSSTMNMVNQTIKDTGLIESAAKVIENVFTNILTNPTVVQLLGALTGSSYSCASTVLASFVPQVIKRLKQNCEANNGDCDRYLRIIIENASMDNMTFLVNDFINGFNNPISFLGRFDTYSIGMKVCSGIMAIINNRFVVDKILTGNDWKYLIEKYLMPIFGESNSDIKRITEKAKKLVKSIATETKASNAQTTSLNSIASSTSSTTSGTTTSSGNDLFSNIMKSAGNIAGNITSKIKSGVSKVGNAIGSIGSSIGNAISGALSFIGGLFGRGEYVGKGKDIQVGSPDNSTLGLNNFPYYSQHMNYSDKPSLSESGCGPTSAAMVLTKVTGKNIFPNEIADESFKVGLYDENGSNSNLFPYIGSKYGVNVQTITDFKQVKEYAKQGIPMIISGKGGNLYGSDGHIVATFGRNKNGYVINDPSNPYSNLYNENSLKSGFKEAWVFGNKGFKQDLKDSEIVIGKDTLYGKGEQQLSYVNGFPYWTQVGYDKDIENRGCGPTSLAMGLTQITGKTITPRTLFDKGEATGTLVSRGSYPTLFPTLSKDYDVETEYISSFSKAEEYSKQGYPVIYDGRKSKHSVWAQNCILTPYGKNGHFVISFGKVGDEFVINDPRGSKYSGLRTRDNMIDGFKYAIKIGDKKYTVDSSKVKKVGDTNGVEYSGSSTVSSDSTTDSGAIQGGASSFFGDMATAAVNFSNKLFGFDIGNTSATDSSAASNVALTSDGELTTTSADASVPERIFTFCKAKGLSDAAAAGILGNAWCESNFSPEITDKTAFGLFQWLHKYEQFEQLGEVAASLGVEWTDPDAQLNYMWSQLQDSTHQAWLKKQYDDGLEGFKKETNAYQAGVKFNKFFERGKGDKKRGDTAKLIYDKYIKNGKLVNIEEFIKTGKGFDLVGRGDKVKLSSKIVEYALSFLNKGFGYSQDYRDYINNHKNYSDCSSFTNHVYDRAAGINIGGYTEEQYLNKKGTNVSKDKLLPSDIILYKNTTSSANHNYKDGVSHAALYIGENACIHSTKNSTGHGIKVSSINSKWSNDHWLTGKRYINPDEMVDPNVNNPNKLTGFTTATGSYTIPAFTNGWETTGNTDTVINTNEEQLSAASFFGDMATAAVNFSNKLFGFDITDNSTTSTSSGNYSAGMSPAAPGDFLGKWGCAFETRGNGPEFQLGADPGHSDNGRTYGIYQWNSYEDIPGFMKYLKAADPKYAKIFTNSNNRITVAQWKQAYATYPEDFIKHQVIYETKNWYKWQKDMIKKQNGFNVDMNRAFQEMAADTANCIDLKNNVWGQAIKSGATGKELIGKIMDNQKTFILNNTKNSLTACNNRWGPNSSERKKLYEIYDANTPPIDYTYSVGRGDTDDFDEYFEKTLNAVKTSDFGIRDDDEFHTGVDYAAVEDTPISSPIDGTVVENDLDDEFGNTLVVKDKKNKKHRFAHMKNQSSFGLGSKVRRNDIIGNVGSTGRSTGSHLHYEVTDKQGISLNPKDYAMGGKSNKLNDVTLSFNGTDSKVKANVSNFGKGNETISEKTLVRLINLVIQVLTKISDNTSKIGILVDVVNQLQSNNKSINKYTADTSKTKSQKLLNTLQKGLNSNDEDITNLEYILTTLEKLATE